MSILHIHIIGHNYSPFVLERVEYQYWGSTGLNHGSWSIIRKSRVGAADEWIAGIFVDGIPRGTEFTVEFSSSLGVNVWSSRNMSGTYSAS